MSCEYAGQLARPDAPEEGPTAVWVCRDCPGGVLVIDPDDHQQHAHPGDYTPPAPPRIPAQRRPRKDTRHAHPRPADADPGARPHPHR